MISLIRLADSPLLLDQFECLIVEWLGNPEPATVEPVKFPGLIEWLDKSPPAVRQYWEMTQRWPNHYLEGCQDIFCTGDSALVSENQGCWTICLKDGVPWHSEEDCALGGTVEQFLVTFGLYELINGQSDELMWGSKDEADDALTPLEKDALLIWEGVYGHPGNQLKFWYHDKGILWYDYAGTVVTGAPRDDQALSFYLTL